MNNRFLKEFNQKNAINLINWDDSPANAIEIQDDGKYLLLGHGSMQEGYSFKVPKTVNFITLTKVNMSCVFNKTFDDEIKLFYKKGFTIFDNNDLSETLSQQGQLLEHTLKKMEPKIEFKNHLGNSIANEMFLDFNTSGTRGIGIVDLKNKSNKIKNIINLSNNRKFKFKQILLSTLLSMYDDHTTNNSKHKTFILCACRNFSGNDASKKLFARSLSGYSSNTTPGTKRSNSLGSS